jgi:hypothetical protein
MLWGDSLANINSRFSNTITHLNTTHSTPPYSHPQAQSTIGQALSAYFRRDAEISKLRGPTPFATESKSPSTPLQNRLKADLEKAHEYPLS